MDLNELIDRTHFDYEQNETKAKQLEDRILKVPGMSKSYLPKRKYGENYKGDQLGVTASSLIAASTPLFKPSLTLAESALTGGELSVITATESVTSRLVTSLMVDIIFPLNY